MDDRRCRSGCFLGVLLALVASGCGSSSGPPTVQVSLLAPTDGATIEESRVFVTGSVQPTASKVVIAGRTVPNHDGRFGVWMSLRPGVTHIRVDARASGYVADNTVVAVRSTPAPAARRRPVPHLLASVGRLNVSTWTREAQAVDTSGCLLHGGWQSYCECALRYQMAAGSPLQVAHSIRAAGAQRRVPYWLKQTIVHCL